MGEMAKPPTGNLFVKGSSSGERFGGYVDAIDVAIHELIVGSNGIWVVEL
jgi:hypothetical protein